MRDLVNKIIVLKYEINDTLKLQDKPFMFQPSHEDSVRNNILATPCTTKEEMGTFAITLYKVIYEETKIGNAYKASLGKYNNHPFTLMVGEFRNYYGHGFSEYVSKRNIQVSDVFNKYLKKKKAPTKAVDFQAIQSGMLNDFIDFLNDINDNICGDNSSIRKSVDTVTGIIEKDKSNIIHCGGVMLPSGLAEYEGCHCEIKSFNIKENKNTKSSRKYQYYSYAPTIEYRIDGIIEADNNKILHCGEIQLPANTEGFIGNKIKITVISPFTNPDMPYKAMARKYSIGKKSTPKLEQPSVSLGEKVIVEQDTEGNTFVGNIQIGKKKGCKRGDYIKIEKVAKNTSKELIGKYPLIATSIQKIVDNNGIAKIYTVEKDEDGIYHVDNILLPPKVTSEDENKFVEGDRIMILQAKENKAKRTKQAYPLFASKVVVLNPDIPEVEEKATVIVSKFDKYIIGPFKWLGDVIISIIKKLLGHQNLIKR